MKLRRRAWYYIVPSGDHSIRGWRKRHASRIARRIGKVLIAEQS